MTNDQHETSTLIRRLASPIVPHADGQPHTTAGNSPISIARLKAETESPVEMSLMPGKKRLCSPSLIFEAEHRSRLQQGSKEEVTRLLRQEWVESSLETKRKYVILATQAAQQQQLSGEKQKRSEEQQQSAAGILGQVPRADLTLPGRLAISKYHNCLVLRNHQLLRDEFWTYGSIIINPEPHFFNEKVVPDFVVDCRGALIAPGFIDVQLNGQPQTHKQRARESLILTVNNLISCFGWLLRWIRSGLLLRD